MKTAIAGYPRIGAHRELKFRTEAFFRGEIDENTLLASAKRIRAENWTIMRTKGITSIPSNDFSLYDNMLDTAVLIGAVGARYREAALSPLGRYFAMARGNGQADLKALTMRKWFNTNYHYLVPEIGDDTVFALEGDKPFAEYREALEAGIVTRPFIIGPFTFLKLSSFTGQRTAENCIPLIAPVYRKILERCAEEGIKAVELGETALVTDLSQADVSLFLALYREILSPETMTDVYLHTSFGDLRDCWDEALSLPFKGIALDFVEGEGNLGLLESRGFPEGLELTAGVVNGKNVWKSDRAKTLTLIRRIAELSHCTAENGRLALGTSCALLHVPVSIKAETALDEALRSRFSFAEEKLDELVCFASGIFPEEQEGASQPAVDSLPVSEVVPISALSLKIASLTAKDWTRLPSRSDRKIIQRERFAFPALPTTTIGSFPQTAEVRSNRARFRKGEIGDREYLDQVRRLTADCIALQEDIGLDVLVHGEFERADMVEFFAQNLDGFAFTANGWVQSYGTRCVKPPVVVSDVSRRAPLTVEMAAYAQSLSTKPVKGMLTGPVTILNWSFPREDIPLRQSAFQIAFAIREEVLELEKNGISIIQIDEAALKEKIPLRRVERREKYLDWAIPAFRLCASSVRSDTQIHTHMCYSDFTDIIADIDALDADVITFEASRSNLSILDSLAQAGFETDVGPGVYDIHSPRVPPVDEIEETLHIMLEKLGRVATRYDGLWINPDCGLKTRGESETEQSLRNLVAAVQRVRHENSRRA